ncbi:MAG: IreB family regulatory phosphoprotein [Bacilli bacterium]|nr:IreB family regulatory phosphoprotein [Bacilli bacterium]MDD3304518.1 IreB family regulatory phosphoprotein [Bacilli bacterium]MDD4053898.1 IreB family regulatory phosphoprotein [Bacilli bacterium]MDD4411267.1 IreB family regulatory phosphoprotein [Bacilli bacterium]
MHSNTTSLFSVEELDEALIARTLKEVYEAIEERGHNPVNQLVGYIMSGDPGYISNHREARSKISKLDRAKIIDVLVRDYFDKIL